MEPKLSSIGIDYCAIPNPSKLVKTQRPKRRLERRSMVSELENTSKKVVLRASLAFLTYLRVNQIFIWFTMLLSVG